MPFVRLGLKFVYSYSDVCIAISPSVEKAILESGARTQIVRLYNPINELQWRRTPEMRRAGRKILGLSEDEFVVLGAGQLIGRKDVEDFIDIAASVSAATFIWVGGRPFGRLSEGIKRIDEKIKSASSNFRYSGAFELSNMPFIYAAADLMLFPSYQENCPLAPLEAAASGIPVIYRDLPAYRSLYLNTYLSVSGSEGFISMTKKMMLDMEYYNYGLNVSKILVSQFDKDKIKKQLVNLYYELINYSTSEDNFGKTSKKLIWT
jgi:1,2-diacylglycerol-3-alpha-glucose alpha-1,2-galactosyltransferase